MDTESRGTGSRKIKGEVSEDCCEIKRTTISISEGEGRIRAAAPVRKIPRRDPSCLSGEIMKRKVLPAAKRLQHLQGGGAALRSQEQLT